MKKLRRRKKAFKQRSGTSGADCNASDEEDDRGASSEEDHERNVGQLIRRRRVQTAPSSASCSLVFPISRPSSSSSVVHRQVPWKREKLQDKHTEQIARKVYNSGRGEGRHPPKHSAQKRVRSGHQRRGAASALLHATGRQLPSEKETEKKQKGRGVGTRKGGGKGERTKQTNTALKKLAERPEVDRRDKHKKKNELNLLEQMRREKRYTHAWSFRPVNDVTSETRRWYFREKIWGEVHE